MKTDKSIRNITLAAIRRNLRKDVHCAFTKLFETETLNDLNLDISRDENELPIAGTFLSTNKITLVTTKRLLTLEDGDWKQVETKNVKDFFPGDFKGYKDESFTVGHINGNDKSELPVFIETKEASMIIMYAIQTLRKILTDKPIPRSL